MEPLLKPKEVKGRPPNRSQLAKGHTAMKGGSHGIAGTITPGHFLSLLALAGYLGVFQYNRSTFGDIGCGNGA